MNISLKQLEDC